MLDAVTRDHQQISRSGRNARKWSDQIDANRHKFSLILAKRQLGPQVMEETLAVNILCKVSQALPEVHVADTRCRYPEVPGSPDEG